MKDMQAEATSVSVSAMQLNVHLLSGVIALNSLCLSA